MKKHKHEGIYSIDLYAYSSYLSTLNPVFKVLFSFIALLMCVIADDIYVSIYTIVVMSFVTMYFGKLGFHEYVSLLTIPIAFMIMGSIAIAFGIDIKPVGQYNFNLHICYLYLSNESIIRTLEIIFKAFGAVCSLYMMTLSTNTSEIISVLKRLHIPKIIIELMNMIYRFIFILIDVQCKMKNSAKSRLGYIDLKTSIFSFGNISKNLLIISMKKANEYYDAMESRCYDGEINFLEEEKEIKSRHIIYGTAYFIILVCIWIFTR